MGYEIGSRVGDYEILQILGSGGMGRVYKVRNVLSDRIEAMKVLLPDLEGNPGLAERFMREIKVQASLDHPNIAALHTALRIDNQLVMLMEYVEGVPLDKMMEGGRIPIDRAVDYIAQVLSALSYAHARGVVHRDLKPGNMMILPNGAVKLMDFGIARMTADRKLTQTGNTIGSLYYMSPEQIKGAADPDPRSDLYSLGVSLFEVITGARPFQGDSEYSIMAAHLKKNPPPPIELSPNLPAGLNEIILQSLEKEPAKRFQTADAFRNALLYVCKQPQAASPVKPQPPPPLKGAQAQPGIPPPPLPAEQATQSHRGLWITIGAVIAIAVIAIVAMQLPKFRKTAAEDAPAQPPPESEAAMQAQEPSSAAPLTEQQPPIPQPASQNLSPQDQNPEATASGDKHQRLQTAAGSGSASRVAATQMKIPVSVPPASEARPPAPAQTTASPPEPAEDPKTAAHLKEVREQLNLLSIRMDTLKDSLDALRKQQAASGLGLRPDMASSAQRMEYYYGRTDAAIKGRDVEAAKKNLDLTEREVARLENFLGK